MSINSDLQCSIIEQKGGRIGDNSDTIVCVFTTHTHTHIYYIVKYQFSFYQQSGALFAMWGPRHSFEVEIHVSAITIDLTINRSSAFFMQLVNVLQTGEA